MLVNGNTTYHSYINLKEHSSKTKNNSTNHHLSSRSTEMVCVIMKSL